MFKRFVFIGAIILWAFAWVWSPTAFAQGAAAELMDSGEQIRIKANQLEVDDKANTVTFIGLVNAVQGKTILTCDKMVIYYTKKSEAPTTDTANQGGREITKIHVIGHVKVVQEDKTATGRQGLYELAAKRIELWGDPKIIQGGNTLTGQKVIVYMEESRAVVQGGRNQVEALIVPQQASDAAQKESDAQKKTKGGKTKQAKPPVPPTTEKNTAKNKAGLKQKAMED